MTKFVIRPFWSRTSKSLVQPSSFKLEIFVTVPCSPKKREVGVDGVEGVEGVMISTLPQEQPVVPVIMLLVLFDISLAEILLDLLL
jgi:hypothetical protein